jgi:hypothetical protein
MSSNSIDNYWDKRHAVYEKARRAARLARHSSPKPKPNDAATTQEPKLQLVTCQHNYHFAKDESIALTTFELVPCQNGKSDDVGGMITAIAETISAMVSLMYTIVEHLDMTVEILETVVHELGNNNLCFLLKRFDTLIKSTSHYRHPLNSAISSTKATALETFAIYKSIEHYRMFVNDIFVVTRSLKVAITAVIGKLNDDVIHTEPCPSPPETKRALLIDLAADMSRCYNNLNHATLCRSL